MTEDISGAPRIESVRETCFAEGCGSLDDGRQVVAVCTKCRLGFQRANAVFGEGNPSARLMFIGEAPGANEDAVGKPFIGRAGQLLTTALAGHGINRDDVFITNIVKCRPPENRDPMPDEIGACSPYLFRQIELIKPLALCALGRYAAATLLGRPVKITKEHGVWLEYRGVPLVIAMHPSAALRSPQFRKAFDYDMSVVAQRYFGTSEDLD